ncbi:MAG: oligosaccharide flippase family protein, partial [Anaerolineales bacterium]|nr:oligosaccharide flippase family protein [Anaerolineales bacterium]
MPTTELERPAPEAEQPAPPPPSGNRSQPGKKIAKNAGVLMASQLLTWGLAILVTIYVPRYLGREGIGILGLAESIWAIMATFVSFGMDVLLAKEIARKPERLEQFFGTQIVTRLLLMVVFFAATIVYVNLRHFAPVVITVVIIYGIVEFFAQMARICRASLQGLEEMQYISLADIVSKAVLTVLLLTLLALGYGVVQVALAAILGGMTSFAVQLWPLRRTGRLKLNFDPQLAIWMLRQSIP